MGVRGDGCGGCEGSRAEGPWPPLSDPRPDSAASPVPPRRKTMLNDLLRFDVKDCSWCRWAAWPLAIPGRWQDRDTPLLSAPRAACRSLWHYLSTREEVSPPPSTATAASCQPAVRWAVGLIDPARGEAGQHSEGEDQGHLCSCSLWEGRGTRFAAPLRPEKVAGVLTAFLAPLLCSRHSVLSHLCLIFQLCQIDFSSSMFVTIYTILLFHKILLQSTIQNQGNTREQKNNF